jgi:amino acid adenylation domain-containing protein
MIYLLDQLLRETVARHAGRPAVAFRERALTYAELDAESDRLARHLRAAGVGPGDRVGISLHKSLESVVSVFGILRAGAVYVPLDPNSPARRVGYIVRNCGMRALVTTAAKLEGLRAALPEGGPGTVVLAGGGPAGPAWPGTRTVGWADAAPAIADPGEARVDSDLAYILYTSGSTGEPKGVMLSHRHALTFIEWAAETFRIGPDDRLANHAPLHFDLSILDIFCAVKAGATVVLVPEGLATFPIRLADFVESERISVWYSVPSALTLMLLHGRLERHRFERLRTVLFAGEVFPVKYLRALMAAIPHAEYYNLYGPTETNVCTSYRVPPLPADRVKPIPIGRAITNADAFALDDSGAVAGPGQEGELYVRGPLVTRGYWADPERTRRAVVRNPLSCHVEELVYRTGDIVVRDEHGDYHLVGRRDHMVKSRGYRIELGEVETALYSHPRVREAAVIPVPDEQVGNRLRAFVVVDAAGGPSSHELKRHCAERVPNYMVPDAIEFRPSLPKTSTGKVDRKALERAGAAIMDAVATGGA